MNVIEIFDSIDGEGKFAGHLATFIRFAGCNLRCTYCDTVYAFTGGKDMSIDEIVTAIQKIGNKHVTITGGEPLLQKGIKSLIEILCQYGYIVNIETNGSIDISSYVKLPVCITMDYKTISSGVNHYMHMNNLCLLRDCDVLKIVCRESDFKDVEDLLRQYKIKADIYISPIYSEVKPSELVKFAKLLRNKNICNDVIVQLQLHKIIWNPDERGV